MNFEWEEIVTNASQLILSEVGLLKVRLSHQRKLNWKT